MKLSRTNDVFSRAACMVFLCAGIWIFRYLINSPKHYRKSTHPEGPWAIRGARGGHQGPMHLGGAATPSSRQVDAWVGSHPPSALPWLLFLPTTEKPQN